MGLQVESQISDREHARGRLLGASRSAQECLDAGGDFVQVEGFGDVVVGSRSQALHAIGDRVAGGEEEDGQFGVAGAQAFQRLEAVHARHLHVEDDDVRVEARRLGERVEPVLGGVRLPAFVAQGLREQVRQHCLVVDDEHAGRAAARVGRHHCLLVCRSVSPRLCHTCVTARGSRGRLCGLRFLLA